MHPGVQARLSSTGLITRHEALDLGLSPGHIHSLVRHGDWKVVRRGVYTTVEFWETLDPYRGQPLLQAHAALRKMRRGWVLSHDSAAHQLGMDILRPEPAFVHVTRPGFTGAWTKYGVKHHLAGFVPAQVLDVDGFLTLDLARTAVDIARERGITHGLVACDGAMRMGASREALWEAAARMVSWPGVTSVRASIELADPGAQTVGESCARELVLELDIGVAETQFPVRTSRGVAYCDIRVGNHIFEFDGRIKYLPEDRGGVAVRPVEDVVWDEKERQRLICAEGLGMSRIIWADFWGQRRAEAVHRLRREYQVTVERFGVELAEHLARRALEIRRRRGA
jgi:hypothetical protein